MHRTATGKVPLGTFSHLDPMKLQTEQHPWGTVRDHTASQEAPLSLGTQGFYWGSIS